MNFSVACSAGTFHDILSNKCELCPKGTYQDKEGQTKCKRCSQVQLGIGILGAVNLSQCTSM